MDAKYDMQESVDGSVRGLVEGLREVLTEKRWMHKAVARRQKNGKRVPKWLKRVTRRVSKG
jgi:hypothetical protein